MKPKLELSKFNGDTKRSVAWINKAEIFFSIHNITVDEEMIKKLNGNIITNYIKTI